MFNFFVGIDSSKFDFSYCILDCNQNTIARMRLPVSKNGFSQLHQKLLSLSNDPSRIAIAIESSGCYHITLLHFLQQLNYPVFLLNPLLIKKFSSQITLRKTKTDKIDSLHIALFLFHHHGQLSPCPSESSELRELTRERESISNQIARLKNDIEKLLSVLFPELPQHQNPFCLSILNLLKSFPSAYAISSANVEQIHSILSSTQKGRKTTLSASEILHLAKNSIGKHSTAKELILSQKISSLLNLMKNSDDIDKLLHQFSSNAEIKDSIDILCSIKGIGTTSALYFIAEVGDITRFSTYKKLIAYAGVDPTVYESGQFRGQSKISKRGNRHLRRVLFLMAQKVVRFNPLFKEYFLLRKAKDISYKKAIMAVIHKLIRTIFSMLVNKTHFLAQEVNSL